jgi:hypothetical protein
MPYSPSSAGVSGAFSADSPPPTPVPARPSFFRPSASRRRPRRPLLEHFQIQPTAAGFWWSAPAGAVNFVGFLVFFAAVEKGKVSTVYHRALVALSRSLPSS